jgi:5-methylcytosine-specific restriction enzyme A
MPRAMKPCSTAGCPELVEHGTSRCEDCAAQADRRRGTATERGYNSRGHRRFRRKVLERDPICVIDDCMAPATIADHWPLSRRELIDRQLDPNNPGAGRGLCKRHHDAETAKHQPGGWNAR